MGAAELSIPTLFSTTDGSTFSTSVASVPEGRLLVVGVAATGTTMPNPTLSAGSNPENPQMRLVASATKNASADTLYVFVADRVTPIAANQSFTFSCPDDPATGAMISTIGFTGVPKSGLEAIRQFALTNNIAGGTAPSAALGQAPIRSNPVAIFTLYSTNSTAPTAPSNFTRLTGVSISTPVSGHAVAARNNNQTATAIQWSSSTLGSNCSIALEIDASSLPGFGALSI